MRGERIGGVKVEFVWDAAEPMQEMHKPERLNAAAASSEPKRTLLMARDATHASRAGTTRAWGVVFPEAGASSRSVSLASDMGLADFMVARTELVGGRMRSAPAIRFE